MTIEKGRWQQLGATTEQLLDRNGLPSHMVSLTAWGNVNGEIIGTAYSCWRKPPHGANIKIGEAETLESARSICEEDLQHG